MFTQKKIPSDIEKLKSLARISAEEKAAEQDTIEAIYMMGLTYFHSNNYPEAIKYIRNAADKNHAPAIIWIKEQFYSNARPDQSLITYHAGLVVTDDIFIKNAFNELAHVFTDKFISLLEDSPDDSFDKIKKNLTKEYFQYVCTSIKNKAAIQFIAITHCTFNIPDLSSLILTYLVLQPYLNNIQHLAKSPENLNMSADLFRMFYHVPPSISQFEEKPNLIKQNKI